MNEIGLTAISLISDPTEETNASEKGEFLKIRTEVKHGCESKCAKQMEGKEETKVLNK